MDGAEHIRWKAGGVAALLALFGMAIALTCSVLFPQKPPARNYADGAYRNEECGVIDFRGGTAHFGSSSIGYRLERQKDGISALSAHLIGVERSKAGCRIVYDTSRDGIYLSFGRNTPPDRIRIWDFSLDTGYDFYREPEKSAPPNASARPKF